MCPAFPFTCRAASEIVTVFTLDTFEPSALIVVWVMPFHRPNTLSPFSMKVTVYPVA